jgi:hypothetical protein
MTSQRAWVELLHAEVAYILREAGVRCLHIKGPTVVKWLYAEDGRHWGDVDILVSPAEMGEAIAALAERGFSERFTGVNRQTTEDHAITVRRTDPAIGLDEVDVHDRFPGLDADPDRAFELLWRRREPDELAHTPVWFPDWTSRALICILNTARTRDSAQAMGDLERLVSCPDVWWDDVVYLGRQLGALPAVRVGLELLPAGVDIVAGTALAEVPPSREWQLRVEGAPRTAVRLDQLRRTPPLARAALIARWLVPSPAVMRMREGDRISGHLSLAQAYGRRLAEGTRSLPASLRAVRRTE